MYGRDKDIRDVVLKYHYLPFLHPITLVAVSICKLHYCVVAIQVFGVSKLLRNVHCPQYFTHNWWPDIRIASEVRTPLLLASSTSRLEYRLNSRVWGRPRSNRTFRVWVVLCTFWKLACLLMHLGLYNKCPTGSNWDKQQCVTTYSISKAIAEPLAK